MAKQKAESTETDQGGGRDEEDLDGVETEIDEALEDVEDEEVEDRLDEALERADETDPDEVLIDLEGVDEDEAAGDAEEAKGGRRDRKTGSSR